MNGWIDGWMNGWSSLDYNSGEETFLIWYNKTHFMFAAGVAPGEGYSPPWEHASPPSTGEKTIFWRFLAFIAL